MSNLKPLTSRTAFRLPQYFLTVLSLIEAGIVSSLVLGLIDLRGFCLIPLHPPLARGDEGGCLMDYRQKNPLKHNACLLSITEKSLMSLNPVLLVNSAGFLE
jgi:hypothetical protein